MRIMFVTPSMNYGGAERVISILCNEWERKRHSICLVITGENNRCVYPLAEGIKLVCLGGINAANKSTHLKLVKKIRRIIKIETPDVVITFINDICAYTAISMIGLKIPLIYSERNDPNKVNQRKRDKIFRKIAEYFSNGIVFQTRGAQSCYSKKVQKKSTIILNPMNIKDLPKCDYENARKEIVSVGRLEPQKNQKLLIEAFSKIEDKYPEYILKIYGTGSLEQKLKEQIRNLSLEFKVFLMGNSNHILEDIKEASLFVLSSDFEGLPNSLIEAMALGLPCLSTDCSPGGAREVIKNGENGLLTKCGDINQLAEAMMFLLKKRSRSIEFGQKAMRIREKVESSHIADRWLEFIKDCKK